MKPLSKFAFASALTLFATATQNADACGGLFCSQSNPVNQAAERIIFAQGDDGVVTAIIEIQYEGPSENFAWVLPVPAGEVSVGVSSKQALDALQQQSNPQYNFNTQFEGCDSDDGASDDDAAFDDSAPEPEPDNEAGGVEVVVAGNVGPYDYVQLAVDESLPEAADVAVTWLEENGYDVTNIGADLIGPYLEEGMDLIAFRLTKGNASGSIRPVAISYEADNPMIPIKPTAVAANDDMGVMVWVLGDSRAVPVNYLHLELNEAKINWFNPAPTYNDVIVAAADEAGGHGFVTEQSGDAATFSETLFPSWKLEAFEMLRAAPFSSMQEFFYSALDFASTFNPTTSENEYYDGFLDVMSDPEVVPLREGATAEQFLECVDCYFQVNVPVRNDAYPTTPYDPETDPIHTMSVTAFLDALEELVVTPLTDTQALFDDHDSVTRFYTTLSADEMTVDPIFDFNADLPAYDNVHTATRLIGCDGDQRVTLPQGMVIETDGVNWPVSVEDELPMNYRILQLSTSGTGEVTQDNSDEIASALTDLGIGAPSDPEDPVVDPDQVDDDVSDDDVSDDDVSDDDVSDDDVSDDDEADDSADDDGPSTDENDAGTSMSPDSESTVSDGCGCRVGASSKPLSAAWLLLLPLGVALIRRRRRTALDGSEST